MHEQPVPAACGVDLGGSKIETSVFDASLNCLHKRRVQTPTQTYDALRDALAAEITWARSQANRPDLPVGIGLPGIVDPATGMSVTANLPATGHCLARDLRASVGGAVRIENDSKTFALSEARGGAGAGYSRVFGLVLGTGLGGGLCVDGRLESGANGLAGEIGHTALPGHLVQPHSLPMLACGCGRVGCVETLVSGTGIRRLAAALTGSPISAQDIFQGAAQHDRNMRRIRDVWLLLAAELVHTIQLFVDPDCIVLGGGLSNVPDMDIMLSEVVATVIVPSVRPPRILQPAFGDTSGCRGAALLVGEFTWDG